MCHTRHTCLKYTREHASTVTLVIVPSSAHVSIFSSNLAIMPTSATNLHIYPCVRSCFSKEQCGSGKNRLYCTQTADQDAIEQAIRISFRDSDAGQIVSRIRSSQGLPNGSMISPSCDNSASCIGGMEDAGSVKFIDFTWRPDCSTQLGLFILVRD